MPRYIITYKDLNDAWDRCLKQSNEKFIRDNNIGTEMTFEKEKVRDPYYDQIKDENEN